MFQDDDVTWESKSDAMACNLFACSLSKQYKAPMLDSARRRGNSIAFKSNEGM